MLQLLIAGLTVGSEYGLIALGIHIILRSTRIVSFAQGEFAIVGGLIAYSAVAGLHVSVWLGLDRRDARGRRAGACVRSARAATGGTRR